MIAVHAEGKGLLSDTGKEGQVDLAADKPTVASGLLVDIGPV